MKAMKAKRVAAPAMKAMNAKRVAAAAPAMKAMKAKRVAAAAPAMKAKRVAAAAPAMKAMKAKREGAAAPAMKAMKAKRVAAAPPAMKAMKAKKVAAACNSFVCTNDIAEAAVVCLVEGPNRHGNKFYDLTGPQPQNMDEIAADLSSVLGKKVVYRPQSLESFEADFGPTRAAFFEYL